VDTRDAITNELLAGETPYRLSKKYPRASVYRIYNELVQSGRITEPGSIVVETEERPEGTPPFVRVPSTSPPVPPAPLETQVTTKEREAGVDKVEIGATSLPVDVVNRIRGILGISFRPKVLSCPTPELLYPSMVISVTELGFPAMRPDDFIDTVLYQWLEACDIVPYAFIKKSELEELARRYAINNVVQEEVPEEVPTEEQIRSYEKQVREDRGEPEPEEVPVEPPPEEPIETMEEEIEVPEDLEEQVNAMRQEIKEVQEREEVKQEALSDEPHKPTIGELLKGLHISNIQKEVEENDGAGCPEPISP